MKAPCNHLPHGVGCDGGIAPVVGPVGPGGGDGPLELAVWVCPGLGLQLREEPRDPIGVLRLPRPRVDAVAHVPSPALEVGGESGAPDAPCGRKLCAVSVSRVANALGGQRAARISSFPSALH